MRHLIVLLLILATAACSDRDQHPAQVEITDMALESLIATGNVPAIRHAIITGETTPSAVTAAYIERIRTLDGDTNAVLSVNPNAMAAAEALDAQVATMTEFPPLFGIPVLVKDNIETWELPTTAGSLALKDNLTGRDALIIQSLRQSGAIILGKTNLSEWANFRSRRSSSGWSGVGGQTRNAFDSTRSPCGSSSGSAVAVAARLAPLAIGTETNGSVICPAQINGIVGLKPSIGLLPQNGIVPISHSQDTAGPMALDVESAALLMAAMQGGGIDYTSNLGVASLNGKRIGIVRSATGYHDDVDLLFNAAVERLDLAGAEIVEDLSLRADYEDFRKDTYKILLVEFKHDLNQYLADLPNELSSLTLTELIRFNQANVHSEMPHFPQDIFLESEAAPPVTDAGYMEALKRAQSATGPEGIDRLIQAHRLDFLVAPSGGPAWKIDHINGDAGLGGFSTFPAVSGYPHITVPMGKVRGMPVGLSITASKGEDRKLIEAAHAFARIKGEN